MKKTEEELKMIFDKFCAEDKNCIDCELIDVVEYDNCGKVFCYRLGYEDGQKDAESKCRECTANREEALACYEDTCQREINEAYERGKGDAVKHGHWTWYYTSKEKLENGVIMYTPHFMCSVCEHRYESYRRYDEPQEEDADFPMYCEHCGTKMDDGPKCFMDRSRAI